MKNSKKKKKNAKQNRRFSLIGLLGIKKKDQNSSRELSKDFLNLSQKDEKSNNNNAKRKKKRKSLDVTDVSKKSRSQTVSNLISLRKKNRLSFAFNQNKKVKDDALFKETSKTFAKGKHAKIRKSDKDRVYGIRPELLDQVEVENIGEIPEVLVHLKAEITRYNGFQSVGIFRKAGSSKIIKELKVKLGKKIMVEMKKDIVFDNNNDSYNENEIGAEKIDIFADLIKSWFRDLPKRIMDKYEEDYFDLINLKDYKQCMKCVEGLEGVNKRLFEWVLQLLIEVQSFKELNKMNVRNLAMVFAPNLFNNLTHRTPMNFIQISSKVTNLLVTILNERIKIRTEKEKIGKEKKKKEEDDDEESKEEGESSSGEEETDEEEGESSSEEDEVESSSGEEEEEGESSSEEEEEGESSEGESDSEESDKE